MMASLDVRLGSRATVETYTEVVLKKQVAGAKHRPDGLIVVNTGKQTWTALVEAKVGAADLTNDQIEAYLEVAKLNGIDAVVTLSNQFTALPTHHPLPINANLTRRVALFHWSWGYVITQAHLLRETGEVADREQLILLAELQRFLLHSSSGVREFDQMPAAWNDLCASVAAGGVPSSRSAEVREVAGAWHQALDRVTSVLSRQLDARVQIELTKAEAADPAARMKSTLEVLSGHALLQSQLRVPDAAAPISLCADLRKRSITLQMRLKAPADRKTSKARVSWLLRQLTRADSRDVHVRLLWPGRAQATQFALEALRQKPDLATEGQNGMVVLSFEVLLVRDLGARFGQRKNFVSELIRAAPEFYDNVAENLTAWQAKPPKLVEAKAKPTSVSDEALRADLEAEALERVG
jgi:hypothetical protein